MTAATFFTVTKVGGYSRSDHGPQSAKRVEEAKMMKIEMKSTMRTEADSEETCRWKRIFILAERNGGFNAVREAVDEPHLAGSLPETGDHPDR